MGGSSNDSDSIAARADGTDLEAAPLCVPASGLTRGKGDRLAGSCGGGDRFIVAVTHDGERNRLASGDSSGRELHVEPFSNKEDRFPLALYVSAQNQETLRTNFKQGWLAD